MYELSNEDFKVNYMPDTIIEEILQNGRTILGTFSGTVPLMREFAQDFSLIDQNSIAVSNILLSRLIPLFKKYEPRMRLKSLDIDMNRKTGIPGTFYIKCYVEVIA